MARRKAKPRINWRNVAFNTAGITQAFTQNCETHKFEGVATVAEKKGGWIGIFQWLAEAGLAMEQFRVSRRKGADWGDANDGVPSRDLPHVYDAFNVIPEALWSSSDAPVKSIVFQALRELIASQS